MYRGLIFFVFMIAFGLLLTAQPTGSSYETKSYTFYQSGKWKELIAYHDSLQKSGTDYYYLRIRSAWAYYYLEETFNALQELDAAHKFWNNPSDAIFRQKLLLLAAEPFAADKALKYVVNGKEKISLFPEPFIRMVKVEGGILPTNDKPASAAASLLPTTNSILGTQDILKQISTGSVAVQHSVIPGLGMYHEFTMMQLQREVETGWRNGFRKYPYAGNQFQYYVNAEYQTTRGWKFSPAYHYVYFKRVNEWTESTLPPGTVVSGLDTLVLNNYLLSAEVSKRLGNFKPSVCFTMGSLNFENPVQGNVSLAWYPQGNHNSFLTGSLTLHSQQNNLEFIPGVNGGKRWGKYWYTDAGFTIGNMYNYSEYNGQLLFNISDMIKWKAFMGVKFIRSNCLFGITLPVQQRERYLQVVVPNPPNAVTSEYQKQSYLAGGLLVSFQYNFTQKSL